jgi:hypothetical protein
MSFSSSGVEKCKSLYFLLLENAKLVKRTPFLKFTQTSTKNIAQLFVPKNREEFRAFISNLYITLYEGSGSGKRIPEEIASRQILRRIQRLRNYYEHDPERGKVQSIQKKYKEIGDIFQSIIGKRNPLTKDDWSRLGNAIIEDVNQLLFELLERYDEIKSDIEIEAYVNKHETEIEAFFEQRITIFPENRVKYREIKKTGQFHSLSDCPIFLPTFTGWHNLPQFGQTKSAIYLSSKAFLGDLSSFTEFIREIEKIWLQKIPYDVGIEKLIPWSISNDGYLVYGSGVKNLLDALRTYDFGVITIILQGIYGEDYSKTFFIIINSYRKGKIFRETYIDFYLCNVHLDWSWINQINNTLDLLSERNEKASSYSLKSFYNYVWRATSDLKTKNKLVGGIGRNGYDNDREYDYFEGLILAKDDIQVNFEFDRENSWILNGMECPVQYLDEFVIDATNRPPSVKDINEGTFLGIRKPSINMLIFDGKGCDIYAIIGWGRAI